MFGFVFQDRWGVPGSGSEHVCSELVQGQGAKLGVWAAAQHGQNCEFAQLGMKGRVVLPILGLLLGIFNHCRCFPGWKELLRAESGGFQPFTL